MQCTVEYRWMTRSQAGEGSTMEERLDMETERSGIVSANATVRRRRRFSSIEMKRKLERWYCRCIWVSSILCGLAAVIIITAAVREISCNASSIPFYKKIKPWRQNRNCVCSLITAQTQFFLKVKNRHHLAAAAEALVKSGANGKREVHNSAHLCKESPAGATSEGLWGDEGEDQSRRTRLDRPLSQLKIRWVIWISGTIVDAWVTQQLLTSWKANRITGHMTTTGTLNTVLQCNAPTILHPFGSNLVVPFTFLISLCLTWHCPQSDRVIYWFTLSLSCLASISCKRQSSREHGVMLVHSALLPYLFLLLPFLPTSLQRSRSWAQIRIWGRMFSCFTMPDKCVFCLKWGLGLWPIFSFKFNHIASRLNFSCCKNCRFGKWWR